MTRTLRSAFTLIELLIVVAIIAILAAIAVPNFLEAQTRSKVSRVKNDQRVYATALEAYCLDWNRYPGDQDNNPFHATERGFFRLTTPVAFITTLLSDPFSTAVVASNSNNADIAAFYAMASGSNNDNWGRNPTANGYHSQNYVILSLGPDKKDSSDDQDDFPGDCVFGMYDPTNGTVSGGDVLRFGGDYRVGIWRLVGDAKATPAAPQLSWRVWNPGHVIPQ